ncbi:MAG: sensor histidine kinase [Candidatus Bipolaricaulia bacterium]
MKRRGFSLRYKFVLTLVAFTFLLSASFGAISLKRLSSELESQLLKDGKELVNTLAERFADTTIPFLTWVENLRFLAETLAVSGDVLFIQVMVGGQTYTAPRPGLEEVPPLEMGLATEGAARRKLADGVSYLDVWESLPSRLVMTDEGIKPARGYVRVGLSFARIRSEIRQELGIIALVSLCYLLIGILVAFIFYEMILGPVEELSASVRRFRVDRRARAPVKGSDELSLLAEEFNKMAEAIAERDERLSEANRVKSEFLAMMGHELLTPLHAIRGFSQLLLEGIEGPLTAKQREDIEAVLSSGNHLLELIENILRFSKLEAGEERLHLEEIESTGLVAEVVQSFERFAQERGLRLESRVEPFSLWADRTKLRQVLMNLVSNALKYTERGGISIEAAMADGQARFTVADTGRGIPPEYQAKVFEPFTQVDSSDRREAMGIGLGLAIVKKYVELHGGRVWLESELGKGTRFHFTIPQEESHADPDR